MRATHRKKGRTERLGLENGRVMELKFIKNDEALKGLALQLKELNARIFYRRRQFRVIVLGEGMQRKKRTKQVSIKNGRFMEFTFIMNNSLLKGLAGQLKELNATSILS